MYDTPSEVKKAVSAAKDSVYTINQSIILLENNNIDLQEAKDSIERNLTHLQHIVNNENISNSGEDLSELFEGINIAQAKLSEDIWNT